MKFDNHAYWKHEDCMDVFIEVHFAHFDEDGKSIVVWGHWMIQGMNNHWYASEYERIFIKADQYNKWKPYDLKTSRRFA